MVYNKPCETFLLPYPEPGIDLNPPEPEEEPEPDPVVQADGSMAPAPAPQGPPPPQINAGAEARTQQQFGQVWSTVSGKKVPMQAAAGPDAILAKLGPMGFKPLAKGNTPDGGCKMYIYCGFTDGMYGYVEMLCSPTNMVQVTVKCDSNDMPKTDYLLTGLKSSIC